MPVPDALPEAQIPKALVQRKSEKKDDPEEHGPIIGGPASIPDFLKLKEAPTAPMAMAPEGDWPIMGGPATIPDFLKLKEAPTAPPLYMEEPQPMMMPVPDALPEAQIPKALVQRKSEKKDDPEEHGPIIGGPASIPDFLKLKEAPKHWFSENLKKKTIQKNTGLL